MLCIADRGLTVTTPWLHLPHPLSRFASKPLPGNGQGQSILFAFAIGLEPMAPSMAHYQKILRENGFKASPLADANIRCRAADERQGQLL